jgi:hypothetical protein
MTADEHQPSAESLRGAAGFPGQFHPAVHGHEPHQTNLAPHPGSDYIGYVDEPEDPEWFTLHSRDADYDDLCNRQLVIEEQFVVDLGDWR